MGFELGIFSDERLEAGFLDWLVQERAQQVRGHFSKLWEYYVNRSVASFTPAVARKLSESGRCYVQGQEYGLPARITGLSHCGGGGVFGGEAVRDVQRKEVVIENDIGWRINSAVDFLFGKPVSFLSRSAVASKRAEIEGILKALFSANGGIGFFQDMGVLGGVYGFVDCFVRPGEPIMKHFTSPSHHHSLAQAVELAKAIDLELIEAPRALPVLEENDCRKIRYYVQHFYQASNTVSEGGTFLSRLLAGQRGAGDYKRGGVTVTEVAGARAWQRYEDGQLVGQGHLPWDFVPVVHVQNVAQPFYYEGLSDVEPLIPLQDELNTRLSDRANRITFQAFKMYLGKGIEGFEDKPVAPGRMWSTDNMEATVEEFGGDSKMASEEMHIAEIREAMDKVSGVTPVVAGVLKSKLGNLTSAVALRLTLMGMLSKTERKRFTYGQGLKEICRMALRILSEAKVYETDASEREVEVIFADPLPENTAEKLKEAQMKKELGVPAEHILRELGYDTGTVEQSANRI